MYQALLMLICHLTDSPAPYSCTFILQMTPSPYRGPSESSIFSEDHPHELRIPSVCTTDVCMAAVYTAHVVLILGDAAKGPRIKNTQLSIVLHPLAHTSTSTKYTHWNIIL